MTIYNLEYDDVNKPPKACVECEEAKSVLVLKPLAIAVDGDVAINVNLTAQTKWVCLTCLSMDIDGLGGCVEVVEYD